MTVEVRLALPKDAERLAHINVQAWRAAYTEIVPQARLDSMSRDEYAERWARTLQGDGPPFTTVFAAEVDGAVASYCSGGPYRPQDDAADEAMTGWGEIYALYTDPDQQGRGAGTAVHDALLAYLLHDGFTTAALWVLEANLKAQRWYADRGWRPDGSTADWVSDGIAHPEIRLRRTLINADAVSSRPTV